MNTQEPPRIAVYGNFGTRNLGNECTLAAYVANLRHRLPEARICVVCPDPAKVELDHGLAAVPFAPMDALRGVEGADVGRAGPPGWRHVDRAVRWIRRELAHSRVIRQELSKTTELHVAGTGVLEDDSCFFGWLFGLLKWCVIAKRSGCRVAFVSIGLGPVRERQAKWFVRRMLSLADYVSYRDQFSMDCARSVGVSVAAHHVFPDLALSLRTIPAPVPLPRGAVVTIGIGVVDRAKFIDDAGYATYIETLAALSDAVAARSGRIRILHGDAQYDLESVSRLGAAITRRHPGLPVELCAADLTDFRHLLAQLADLDAIVASRFHNVVLALLAGTPVVGLAYHPKFASLLDDAGLADFSLELREATLSSLTRSVNRLMQESARIQKAEEKYVGESRRRLEVQYDLLFGGGARAQ